MQRAIKIIQEVKKAVIGKDDCVIKVMAAILAGGHILIEDVPGVGKTTLALAFSRSMSLSCKRISFTPDVLPADITGFSLYQKESGQFIYQPGAVMCNLFIADEINRTSPKTQSALLEVMEEGKVTVEGVSREVPNPFFVIATENPIGSAGTQLLPESQLDRFMIQIQMGYPDIESEIAIAKGKGAAATVDHVSAAAAPEDLLSLQKDTAEIFIHDDIFRYIGQIVNATREHPMIELGISPRGTIAITKMTKAYAFLQGRTYALPEDVDTILPVTVLHRLCLNTKARTSSLTAEDILKNITSHIKKPNIRGN